MIDVATQMTVIPGAVWKKAGKKRDFYSTILFVTNQGLKEEVLEKHPQQVVFLTEELKVMTQTVEFFIGCRTYHDMDTDLEALLSAITTPIEEDGDEDIDIDAIDLADTLTDAEGDVIEADLIDDDADPVIDTDTGDNADLPDEISGDSAESPLGLADHPLKQLLQENFVSYQESPYHTGDTLCTLKFMLGDDLSVDHLRSAFTADEPTAFEAFSITSHGITTNVVIDGYLPVFLEIQGGGRALGIVYVTTMGDVHSVAQDPVVEDDAPETYTMVGEALPQSTINVVVADNVQASAVPAAEAVPA